MGLTRGPALESRDGAAHSTALHPSLVGSFWPSAEIPETAMVYRLQQEYGNYSDLDTKAAP